MGLKSLELEATRENILETMSSNLLDRNNSVWQFACFCNEQEAKCSIAIDAKWGYGKTFFVKQTKLLLESYNNFTNTVSDAEKTIIHSAFLKYIGSGENQYTFEPHVCVYYDAWSNDNDVDPILSLIYEILKETSTGYSFKKSRDFLKIAASMVDFFTGKNVKDIIELVKGEDPFSELKQQKDIHNMVEEFLDYLLYEQGNRLVVFIDELDRCKPSFAVHMLERIKHYFSNDRITFVFSLNADELQHTVKHYYGNDFDACRYLDRFFDYRIALPPANLTRYYEIIGLENGSYVYEALCRATINHFSFGLREIEKYYRTAKIAAYDLTHNRSLTGFSSGNGQAVGIFLFVPIIIALRMVDADLYNNFIDGKNPSPLIEIIGDGNMARGFCKLLLDSNETYDEEQKESKIVVKIKDKLSAAYNALFNNSNQNTWEEIHVGDCAFSRQTRDLILKITSGISEYSVYDFN